MGKQEQVMRGGQAKKGKKEIENGRIVRKIQDTAKMGTVPKGKRSRCNGFLEM